DVPERGVDAGNRAHGHRAAPPIGAAIEILPDVLDLVRVTPDQAGNDMLFEIGHDRQFAAIERRVTNAVKALVGHDLDRDEIASGRADDDLDVGDFHDADS